MSRLVTYLVGSLFWSLFASVGYAQTTVLDSLAQKMRQLTSTRHTNDTNYVLTLCRYGRELRVVSGRPQTIDSLGRVAEAISRKLNFGDGVNRALTVQAGAQFALNNPEGSIRLFKQLLADVPRYHLPVQVEYSALSNLGVTYRALSRTDEAMAACTRAVKLEQNPGVTRRSENLYRALVYLFVAAENFPKAAYYAEEGIKVAIANTNLSQQAQLEADLATAYSDQRLTDKAIAAFKQALTHCREAGDKLTESDVLLGLAYQYDVKGQTEQALRYGQQGLALAKAANFGRNIAAASYTLGRIYHTQKQYSKAKVAFQEAIAGHQELGNKLEETEATVAMSQLAADQNDYKTAYTLFRKWRTLNDSLMNDEQKTRTDQLVAKYESEKKEAQIKLLQQQAQLNQELAERTQFRNRVMLFGGILILLLGVASTAWLLNRAKLRRLEEAQSLRKQIAHDLHDEVGSTLSSISLLSDHTDKLLTQNRPEKAQQMVQKIYVDARQILDAIDEIIWTINPGNDSLQRIILRLREYAQPLMESRGIQLKVETDVALDSTELTMETRRNLYLVCKEAINNLVKYSEARTATIRFNRSNDQLTVSIVDDGKGFEPAQLGGRTGQVSMQQRANAIGGQLAIQSAPGEGTQMELSIQL